jgi:hypothetical protein
MRITVNALTALRPGPQQYRLRKCLSVVQFDQTAKGRVVFLPEGTELCVVGPSRLRGCLEVLRGRQLYNIFKVDLLGPRFASVESKSAPVEAKSEESNGIDLARVAVGAYA